MTQRPSLLDQAGISAEEPAKPAKAGKGAAVSGEQLKLAVAAALLFLAAVAVAWGLGAFRGGPPKPDPARQSQMQQRFEEQQEEEKRQDAVAPQRRIEAGG